MLSSSRREYSARIPHRLTTARADAVTDWNIYANAAIFATTGTAHGAVLSTAMVQGAVYDAVNAIAGGYQP